jgi:hypothetical protein
MHVDNKSLVSRSLRVQTFCHGCFPGFPRFPDHLHRRRDRVRTGHAPGTTPARVVGGQADDAPGLTAASAVPPASAQRRRSRFWENHRPGTAPVAQWIEQPPSKRLVAGSNPAGGTHPRIRHLRAASFALLGGHARASAGTPSDCSSSGGSPARRCRHHGRSVRRSPLQVSGRDRVLCRRRHRRCRIRRRRSDAGAVARSAVPKPPLTCASPLRLTPFASGSVLSSRGGAGQRQHQERGGGDRRQSSHRSPPTSSSSPSDAGCSWDSAWPTGFLTVRLAGPGESADSSCVVVEHVARRPTALAVRARQVSRRTVRRCSADCRPMPRRGRTSSRTRSP